MNSQLSRDSGTGKTPLSGNYTEIAYIDEEPGEMGANGEYSKKTGRN